MTATIDLSELQRVLRAVGRAEQILGGEAESAWQYTPAVAPEVDRATFDLQTGDIVHVLFGSGVAVVFGHDHEVGDRIDAAMREGMFEGVPEHLAGLARTTMHVHGSPGFATFCRWARHGDTTWTATWPAEPLGQQVDDEALLAEVVTTFDEYLAFAVESHGRDAVVAKLAEICACFGVSPQTVVLAEEDAPRDSGQLASALDVDRLRKLTRAAAQSDRLLGGKARWTFIPGRFPGVDLAHFQGRADDVMTILIGPDAAVVVGYEFGSPLDPFEFDPPHVRTGMFDGIPPSLEAHLAEALETENGMATLCRWRASASPGWQATQPRLRYPEEDAGTGYVLERIPMTPAAYLADARADYPGELVAEHEAQIRRFFGA